MTYRGGASLAWQSDYTQIYLIDDAGTEAFQPPGDITDDMMRRRWCAVPSGLVVYTNDCLQQVVEIRVFDAEPPLDANEWRSGLAWTQIESAEAVFPSKQFAISSPSKGGSERCGPIFRLDATDIFVRILWMEHEDARDDSAGPVQPDVIRLDIWPRAGS